MEVEVRDAQPGEIARKLPRIVERLLLADPLADDELVKAVVEGIEDGHAGAHDAAERFWRWKLGAKLSETGRQVFARRYARIAARITAEVFDDDELVKAWSIRGAWGTVAGGLRRGAAFLAEKMARMRRIVADEHAAAAVELYGPDVVDPETLRRLSEDGTITEANLETAGELGILGAAGELGAVLADDPTADDLSLADARRMATNIAAERAEVEAAGAGQPPAGAPPGNGPPSEVEPPPEEPEPARPETLREAASQHARARGGQLIVGLGNSVADDLSTIAIDSNGERAQELRQRIAGAVATSISEGAARHEIRRAVVAALEGDYARDIDRIVETETHAAMQQAYADRTVAKWGKGAQCAVITSPSACPACIRLYTDGGRPRIFRLATLPPSSVNFRRKSGDRVACVPPLHPWCGCHMVRVPAGWVIDEDGIVMPPKRLEPTPEPAAATPDEAPDEAPDDEADEPLTKSDTPTRPLWTWGARFGGNT